MDIPASGNTVSVMGVAIYRIVDGQIAEAWMVWDALRFMQQIGAGPAEP